MLPPPPRSPPPFRSCRANTGRGSNDDGHCVVFRGGDEGEDEDEAEDEDDGDEDDCALAEGFAIRLTAPAAVNARAGLLVSRC